MGKLLVTVGDPQLTMAATDRFAPDLLAPPVEWFHEFPDWFDDVPLNKVWVDSEGRMAARTFGPTCLLDGNESACWIPPASPTNYEVFHQGAIPYLARTGSAVTVAVETVGVVGGNVGHAPENLSFDAAHKWYASTGDQLMLGRAFDQQEEDGVHGYLLGAILPHLTVEDVAKIRRSGVSCDWRYRLRDNAGRVLNAYDNLGPWLVTRPGLPLDRRGAERAPRMRYRPMAASISATHEGVTETIPGGYLLEPYESESPMFCSHCGTKLDNGTNASTCACQGGPHVAAMQAAPAQDPEMAPEDHGAEMEQMRGQVAALTEAVAELAAGVAELMMRSVDVEELSA